MHKNADQTPNVELVKPASQAKEIVFAEEVTIEIPAGIQSGKQLRQRGAGMPVLQGRGRGDLVVEIAVETPTRLSKEQRALLEQFRELETGDECPESRGFFDKLKDAFGG